MPITVGLSPLGEDALVKILTEPKNSLVKQYVKLFKIDDIDLQFDKDALLAIAQKVASVKTGARGLRSVLENTMLGCMYEAPSAKDIESVRITRKCGRKRRTANNAPRQLKLIQIEAVGFYRRFLLQ